MLQVLPPPDARFAQLITGYRRRADLSQTHLAIRAGLDPSYVSRLEQGGRSAPGRDIIHRLAAGLELSAREEDQLLLLAGHAPLWLMAAARGELVSWR